MRAARIETILLFLCGVCGVCGVRGGVARAEDVTTAPVEVRAAKPAPAASGSDGAAREDRERALEEPAFVTVIRADGQRGESATVAEVLAEAVGVQVRSLGGLGAFASISLRGASAGQTEILVDGVPLSRFASSSVDVSALDLGTFERVEVYRGGVPAELGGAVLGGAVNFVSAVGPRANGVRNELSVGGGSFGARRVRAARHDGFLGGLIRMTVQASYAGATGDFDFYDDRGTPLNPDDDTTTVRKNNGYDQLDVAARARIDHRFRAEVGDRFTWKTQGVPGPMGVQAEEARLTTIRNVFDFKTQVAPPDLAGVRFGVRSFVIVEALHWEDPAGEVGIGTQDERYLTTSAGGGLDGAFLLGSRNLVRLSFEGRMEGASRIDERAAGDEPGSGGSRLGLGVALGDEIVIGEEQELVVIPALRVDFLGTRGDGLAAPAGGGGEGPEERDDRYVSPRIGVRWRVSPGVSVKANAGRYFRPPTLTELFGDRGYIVGNASLEPETGIAGDVGLVLSPPRAVGPFDRLYLEWALFASRPRNLIATLMTAGRFARAANLGDARIGGHEIAFAARAWKLLTVSGNYTFLDTSQRSTVLSYDGKQLPGRPRHEAYLRAELAGSFGRAALGGFVDVTLVSSSFLDAANTSEVPARRFLGVGVRVAPRPGLVVTLTAKNLLDERVEEIPLAREVAGLDAVPRPVADFLGYPLPGRALYGAVEVSF